MKTETINLNNSYYNMIYVGCSLSPADKDLQKEETTTAAARFDQYMKTMLELLQAARENHRNGVVTAEDAVTLADEYFFGKSNRNTKKLFFRAKTKKTRQGKEKFKYADIE
jgi:hypothetical protein